MDEARRSAVGVSDLERGRVVAVHASERSNVDVHPQGQGVGRCGEPEPLPTPVPEDDQRLAANTVEITEQSGSVVHRVEDAQLAGMAGGIEPRAVCGEVFTPAAMCAPEGVPCPRCADVLRRGERVARQPVPRRRFWAVWR